MNFRRYLKISIFSFILFLVFSVFGVFDFNLFNLFKVNASEGEALYNRDMTYTYVTNVNNPISINGLMTELGMKVLDNPSQTDISYNIMPADVRAYKANVLNQPTSLSRKLGTYNCVFRCYDPYSNYADCVIAVKVVDDEAPVCVENQSRLVYEFTKSEINENTESMVLRGIVAKDNNSCNIEKSFDDFDFNTALGNNKVTVSLVDESNNVGSVDVEITINDDIGPVFTADTTYVRIPISDDYKTFSELNDLFKLTAFDNETNQVCTIEVINDQYTSNYDVPGVYLYEVRAFDINGNVINVSCYVEVYDLTNPQFYINTTKLTVNTKVLFTLDDAKQTVRARKLVKNDNFDLSVVSDDYSDNYDKIGTYKYVVKAEYEDNSNELIEILIEVKDSIEEVSQNIIDDIQEDVETKVGFFKSIFNFLKEGLKMIWNIIKWPFKKIFNF